jgi:hypothetical protein
VFRGSGRERTAKQRSQQFRAVILFAQFLISQRQAVVIAPMDLAKTEGEGGVMKKVLLTVLEPTTATLLLAFAIGFGIAVHPVFFLAALLIAIAALIQTLVDAAGHLTHRHP